MSTTEEQVNDGPLVAQIAPLWRRFMANAIDLGLEALVVANALLVGLTWLAPIVWVAYCIAIVYHCPPSPGKRKLGLHVARVDGSSCTREELLRHELLPFVAATWLFLMRTPMWTWSAAFDGPYRRSPQDHVWGTRVVYCPELSGEFSLRDASDSGEDAQAQAEGGGDADPSGANGGASTSKVASMPGQTSLFGDDDEPAEEGGEEDEDGPSGLLAKSGTVHAAGIDGRPLCGVKRSDGMAPTDQEITCKRCVAITGGASGSKKGADAA